MKQNLDQFAGNCGCWSEQARLKAEPVYQQILELPFIKALAEGSLSRERFNFYLCQDAAYLNEYGAVLAHIASRSSQPDVRKLFLKFAADGIAVENALHESYIHNIPQSERPVASPTCMLYTSILKSRAYSPLAVEAASVLPCFWIYRDAGKHIASIAKGDNPYAGWIATYSDMEFDRSTNLAIEACDKLASESSPEVRQQMTDVFLLCTKMEWMFWQSAWELQSWPV